MNTWSITTVGEDQTRQLGRFLGTILPGNALVLLQGTLGAGKTVFSQGVARGIGIPESTAVNSPTYTLLNHYSGATELYHFDLYRLGDAGELFELGFDELAYGDGVALVEWPERLDRVDAPCLRVEIVRVDDDRRSLLFTAGSEMYSELLDRLRQRWNETLCSCPEAAAGTDDNGMKE